jgi:hypothetical protein
MPTRTCWACPPPSSPHDEAAWQNLGGDASALFVAMVGTDIAVKVIDERGTNCR